MIDTTCAKTLLAIALLATNASAVELLLNGSAEDGVFDPFTQATTGAALIGPFGVADAIPGDNSQFFAILEDPTLATDGARGFIFGQRQLNGGATNGAYTLSQDIAIDDSGTVTASFDVRGLTNDEAGATGFGVLSNTNNSNLAIYDAFVTVSFNDTGATSFTETLVDITTDFQTVSLVDLPVPTGTTFATFTVGFQKAQANNRGAFAFDNLSFDGEEGSQLVVGDFDGDLDVDLDDFAILSDNFFTDQPFGTNGDVTLDGFVGFEDFGAWKDIFVAGGGNPALVTLDGLLAPEPSTLALLALTGFPLLARRSTRS